MRFAKSWSFLNKAEAPVDQMHPTAHHNALMTMRPLLSQERLGQTINASGSCRDNAKV